MDWSKAKNILIAALLITNLMLAMLIQQSPGDSHGREQEELKQNTIALLQNHGIHVEEELISGRTERLPVMSVRYRTINDDMVRGIIDESSIRLSPFASEEEYRRAAESFLKTVGIFGEHHVYETVQREGTTAIVWFGTEYEGYDLDNAKVQVTFRNGRLEDFSAAWAEPMDMGQNRKRVLPDYEALIRFMTLLEAEETGEEVHVDQVQLVYWLEGYGENGGVSEDTAVPYWCIKYNDVESVHIAAYEE